MIKYVDSIGPMRRFEEIEYQWFKMKMYFIHTNS
jgi:hypothetical protein